MTCYENQLCKRKVRPLLVQTIVCAGLTPRLRSLLILRMDFKGLLKASVMRMVPAAGQTHCEIISAAEPIGTYPQATWRVFDYDGECVKGQLSTEDSRTAMYHACD